MAEEAEEAPPLSREALADTVRKLLLQSPPGELVAVAQSACRARACVARPGAAGGAHAAPRPPRTAALRWRCAGALCAATLTRLRARWRRPAHAARRRRGGRRGGRSLPRAQHRADAGGGPARRRRQGARAAGPLRRARTRRALTRAPLLARPALAARPRRRRAGADHGGRGAGRGRRRLPRAAHGAGGHVRPRAAGTPGEGGSSAMQPCCALDGRRVGARAAPVRCAACARAGACS
jgi:hypothetical protein